MVSKRLGFTLIEILVVITIMGILSAVVLANLGEGQAQARDAERKADLRSIQSALELYKLKYGRYPAGCRAPGRWSGQIGTAYQCGGNNSQYIVGLAPEFIPVLPSDAKLNGTDSGYVYTTNAQGTVYKLMARLTVETEADTLSSTEAFSNDFKSCATNINGTDICDAIMPSNPRPAHCERTNIIFQTSYGLWGGFASGNTANIVERDTEAVICNIP